MLSLRDTGRFNGANISVIDVAAKCGLNVPFSISNFIRSNCSEDEKKLRLCVVLFSWGPLNTAEPPFTKKSKSFYENFFLNWENPNGIARFWYKESFGRLKIEGKVLDWTFVPKDPATVLDKDKNGNLVNTINRNTAIGIAKDTASSQGESLDNYDGFIAIMGVDTSKYVVNGDNSGADSTFAIGTNHNHTCHEVGHIIGNINKLFTHSFGLETTGYPGGVYGYPYCIMSAETYGGAYAYFTPKTASTPEEGNRGPGFCGGTRAILGWANSIEFDLENENEAEFEIQSLGSNQRSLQVVFIKKGDRKFFVEYRSSKDENDAAIALLGFDAMVVVGIVSGGIAAGEKDGRHTTNGTFIGQIPVKFSSPANNTIVNFEPNMGIKILEIRGDSKIVIKIVKNFAFSLKTYRRTHDIALSDGSSSFQIDGSPDYSVKCALYNKLREWRINEQPVKGIRDLVNT
jgi:hypothetical protein